MKQISHLIFAGAVGVVMSVTAALADMSNAVGVYDMEWGNGRMGVYEIHSVTSEGATVSYSFGGETQTAVLRVRGNRIVGGGWFPTLRFRNNGAVGASHSGNSVQATRR